MEKQKLIKIIENTIRKSILKEDIDNQIDAKVGNIINQFNINRHGNDFQTSSLEFNVKNPNYPDYEEVKNYFSSEAHHQEEMDYEWETGNFVNKLAKQLFEKIKQKIKSVDVTDWSFAGHMNGWFVILFNPDLGELADDASTPQEKRQVLNRLTRIENEFSIAEDIVKKTMKNFKQIYLKYLSTNKKKISENITKGTDETYKKGDLVFAKNMGQKGLVGLIISDKYKDEDNELVHDIYYRGLRGDIIPTPTTDFVSILDDYLDQADNNGDISAYTSIATKQGIKLNPIYQERLDSLDEISTSAGAGAYLTPNAFSSKTDDKIANMNGYKKVKVEDKELEEMIEQAIRKILVKEDIDENIISENNDILYYTELVNDDKERLKNEKNSGAREEIMQNLRYNQSQLSKAKREQSKPKKTILEPEEVKPGMIGKLWGYDGKRTVKEIVPAKDWLKIKKYDEDYFKSYEFKHIDKNNSWLVVVLNKDKRMFVTEYGTNYGELYVKQ